ncbi:MAG: hypothetical protein JOZ94_05625 [Xanthobacteraceae bacterium]|nr:hypothetical protein [Xanthobacteraceae bacterium]MBV9628863.1 hypothetical protein [Xanthobacteraceae bacterium]
MSRITRWAFGAAALGLVFVTTAALAQERVRVRGTIENVDGNVLTVKTREGQDVKVKLPDNARVLGLEKASIDDIKQGTYVGVSAMPQTDGSQKALHVHIFPDAMRGVAEGFGPWDVRPNSTMTNATVDNMVTGTDGRNITVKYKDGEKKILVPPDAAIVKYVPGNKDALKAGAKIFIVAAVKQPDGMLEAPNVSVGLNGLTPPM